MELIQLVQELNVWTAVKAILIALAVAPNVTLVIKILARPCIQTIFNTSFAVLFGIIAVFGPLVFYFNLEVFRHQYVPNKDTILHRSDDCARLMEFRNAIGEGIKIIGVNIMFRYFYVVYADKGLSVREKSNSTLLTWIYVVFTLGTY